MKSLFLSALIACLGLTAVSGQSLTPEQLASLKMRLESLKSNLNSHITSRNTTAGQSFLNAAANPKAALELYLNCVKMVEYDREGRPEADFRAWKDGQSGNMSDPRFV